MSRMVTVDTRTGVVETDNDRLIMALLLIIMPPLAVFFKSRGCHGQVCLNIMLYFLLVVPAYCHATWYCFIRGRQSEIRADITESQQARYPTS